jgi:tetratricopeptide (TPR) repeat protein
MQRYDKALADLSRDIELDPGYAHAVASRGEIYRRLERYEEALGDFSRAIELNPGDASALANRGSTYLLISTC